MGAERGLRIGGDRGEDGRRARVHAGLEHDANRGGLKNSRQRGEGDWSWRRKLTYGPDTGYLHHGALTSRRIVHNE